MHGTVALCSYSTHCSQICILKNIKEILTKSLLCRNHQQIMMTFIFLGFYFLFELYSYHKLEYIYSILSSNYFNINLCNFNDEIHLLCKIFTNIRLCRIEREEYQRIIERRSDISSNNLYKVQVYIFSISIMKNQKIIVIIYIIIIIIYSAL